MKIHVKISIWAMEKFGCFRDKCAISDTVFSIAAKMLKIKPVSVSNGFPKMENAVVVAGNMVGEPFSLSGCELRGCPLPPIDPKNIGRIL